MRKLSCFAAAMMVVGVMSNARAADPKKGSAKKKSGEMLNDNFDKQMQWENNVMGPDDKKAELAKIARAQAITKAATEKAAVEKAAAERNPPKEEAKRAPATKNAAPVLLATPEDENAGKSTKNKEPQMSTEEAAAPPPAPAKPVDDRFIDKLLKGEPSGKKKVAKGANDDELNDLLAKEKIAPAPKPAKGKRVDSVDDLLRSAEKQPDMPAPKAKQPEWARAEAPTTPAPAPVVMKPQPRKDDGVIHVVQGATGTGSGSSHPQVAAASPPNRRASAVDSFDRRDSDSFDAPRKRSSSTSSSSKPAGFADPFADSGAAPRARAVTPPARPVAPVPAPRAVSSSRRESAGGGQGPGWRDPFADAPDRNKPVKRAVEPKREAPAGHPPGWKDPFSDATPAHNSARVVAMREPHRAESRHASGAAKNAGSGWGLLKKQARH